MSIDFSRHPVELVVREEVPEKTPRQRALFHAVCDEIGAILGYFPGEFKREVKRRYFGNPDAVEELLDALADLGRQEYSSEDLAYEQYGRLIDCAYLVAAELEIVVPDRRRR